MFLREAGGEHRHEALHAARGNHCLAGPCLWRHQLHHWPGGGEQSLSVTPQTTTAGPERTGTVEGSGSFFSERLERKRGSRQAAAACLVQPGPPGRLWRAALRPEFGTKETLSRPGPDAAAGLGQDSVAAGHRLSQPSGRASATQSSWARSRRSLAWQFTEEACSPHSCPAFSCVRYASKALPASV